MVFDPQVPLLATPDRDYRYGQSSDDGDASRMCGQGVITKLLKKSPSFTSNQSSGVEDSSTMNRTCAPKALPFSRRRYEEIHRHLLGSPEQDTESSSTSSDKSSDERRHAHAAAATTAGPYIVQYVHGEEGNSNDASPSTKRQIVQPFNFSRSPPWSTGRLPAVTEESSSVDTEETPLPKDGLGPPTPQGMGIKHTSPEKNEMLAAMRNLVLKQQNALKELSNENSHYRKKMEEYQNMLIKMKRFQAEKDCKISQLQLEKEAYETEAMWLRSQIEAMSQETVIDDDELQQKLRSLMVGGGGNDLLIPSSLAERAVTNAFNSFKGTLSPGTVMDRAVKSLNCSKNPAWVWEMKDGEDDDDEEEEEDDSDRGGHESDSSESAPDDERMMLSKQTTKKREKKQQEDEKLEARDDEQPGTSDRDTSSSPEVRSNPPKSNSKTLKSSESSSTSSPMWTSPDKNQSFTPTKRDAVAVTKQQRPPNKPKPPSKSSSEASSFSSSPMWEKNQACSSTTKGQREEVDVFKQRLESVQKKRTDRQSERKQTSKPVVRFGTIMI